MTLAARWYELHTTRPDLRIRDAAAHLGATEAELVAAGAGVQSMRLRPDWPALFTALPRLGRVMCLTRNPWCVHERKGVFEGVEPSAMHMLVVGPDIDLRGFPRAWASLFAVVTAGPRGWLHSFQIFDRHGEAVHKIYVQPEGDLDAWRALCEALRERGGEPLAIEPAPVPVRPTGALAPEQAQELLLRWAALKDTHDFFPLLRKLGVHREQALRAAEGSFTRAVRPELVIDLLQRVAAEALPIMIFVGNRGMIQIHTGPVQRVKLLEQWLNVLDPDFNLHLRTDGIDAAWIVRKPTVDGDVTSLELFDARGEVIAQVFGQRKPGVPEDARWRALLAELAGPTG